MTRTDSGDAEQEAAESAQEAAEPAANATGSPQAAASAARDAQQDRDRTDTVLDDLLIHDHERDEGLGQPGPPMHRGHPFRFGFLAALGALLAYGLVQAMGKAQSVLVLLVVSLFLAVGLNPLVEWFMRRGVRRGFAVGDGLPAGLDGVRRCRRRDRAGGHRPGERADPERARLARPADPVQDPARPRRTVRLHPEGPGLHHQTRTSASRRSVASSAPPGWSRTRCSRRSRC